MKTTAIHRTHNSLPMVYYEWKVIQVLYNFTFNNDCVDCDQCSPDKYIVYPLQL